MQFFNATRNWIIILINNYTGTVKDTTIITSEYSSRENCEYKGIFAWFAI